MPQTVLWLNKPRLLVEKNALQEQAPCIVFIDEIDAIGRQRGSGMGGGNDEREQTLNQTLGKIKKNGEQPIGLETARKIQQTTRTKINLFRCIDDSEPGAFWQNSGPISYFFFVWHPKSRILTEMDGFEGNSGVIVVAATNRSDILDQALLRPGRFDRRVTVGLPDVQGREQILKVHLRNKKLAEGITLTEIAKRILANSLIE